MQKYKSADIFGYTRLALAEKSDSVKKESSFSLKLCFILLVAKQNGIIKFAITIHFVVTFMMHDNNLKTLLKIAIRSAFFITLALMTLMSNPVLAQDGHWVDNLLPYILFDIAFAVALWVVIALVKITTKLLTIRPQ